MLKALTTPKPQNPPYAPKPHIPLPSVFRSCTKLFYRFASSDVLYNRFIYNKRDVFSGWISFPYDLGTVNIDLLLRNVAKFRYDVLSVCKIAPDIDYLLIVFVRKGNSYLTLGHQVFFSYSLHNEIIQDSPSDNPIVPQLDGDCEMWNNSKKPKGHFIYNSYNDKKYFKFNSFFTLFQYFSDRLCGLYELYDFLDYDVDSLQLRFHKVVLSPVDDVLLLSSDNVVFDDASIRLLNKYQKILGVKHIDNFGHPLSFSLSNGKISDL